MITHHRAAVIHHLDNIYRTLFSASKSRPWWLVTELTELSEKCQMQQIGDLAAASSQIREMDCRIPIAGWTKGQRHSAGDTQWS